MTDGSRRHSTRERILEAAADLLSTGGSDAVSTRAVSAAAGVQAPTLYRLFGDKQGLLDAVTEYGFKRYIAEKRSLERTADPVEDLRRGWDLHVGFGLSHPAFYVLMYGFVQPGRRPPAGGEDLRILGGLVERVARAGRLRVPVDVAIELIHATSVGVTLALIAEGRDAGDPDLSHRAREILLASITTPAATGLEGSAPPDAEIAIRTHATALRTLVADETGGLTEAEAGLLREWLRRLADPAG